ncbi:MAG: SsrA-binding protein SmpB [Solitalea-like symbiont of Tyrophagus putrescentiae]
MSNQVYIKNRKARFNYEILEKYTAGIQLKGTEIKSIRGNKASIAEAFCLFVGNFLKIRNMYIAEYEHGSYYNHEAKRDRVLLITKKEYKKLNKSLEQKGLTIVPLDLFISNKGLAKINIGLAKGKKEFDKRETIKARDMKMELNRSMKNKR